MAGVCDTCGATAPDGAAFCQSCGSPLTPRVPPPGAEQVSPAEQQIPAGDPPPVGAYPLPPPPPPPPPASHPPATWGSAGPTTANVATQATDRGRSSTSWPTAIGWISARYSPRAGASSLFTSDIGGFIGFTVVAGLMAILLALTLVGLLLYIPLFAGLWIVPLMILKGRPHGFNDFFGGFKQLG